MSQPPKLDADDRPAIEDVIALAIGQDSTTWTVLSVFVAAQVVLFGFVIASGIGRPFRLLGIVTGVVVTTASLLLVDRSNRYMKAYFDMLSSTELPRFNLCVPGVPARWVVIFVHLWFYIAWAALFILSL
jgi:hypothetical protein